MKLESILSVVCDVCEIEAIEGQSKQAEQLLAKALYAHYASRHTLNVRAILKTANVNMHTFRTAKSRYNNLIYTDFAFKISDKSVKSKLEQINV